MKIALIVFLIIFVLFLFPGFLVGGIVYTIVLVRNKPGKWGREISEPDDEELARMYREGEAWIKGEEAYRSEVSIVSDGFRLAGEFYDYGYDRTAIIVPGRMEALRYSYYYAIPYKGAACNFLVIDNRCHGLSEGTFNCIGYKEYRDVIAWAKFLHDEKGQKKIFLHGICIGSSTTLFAAASNECPDYVVGLAVDGIYDCFYSSFLRHMEEQKRPKYPFIWFVLLYIRVFSHADAVGDGPKKRILNLQKPILMLHGREDQYSDPDKAQKLYDVCPSKHKQLVWFEKGGHSRIRINAPEQYDAAIKAFIDSVDAPAKKM
ncbi:MAG: alpha/beta hydrolase [Clostridia bacterium]|nr:alpha/beta hydrolase [Clostridia bacterium]